MTTPAVKLHNITKRFPGVIANREVNFEVLPGEIHALLGENGAGKSTLMNILIGLYQPDEGYIELGGVRTELKGPADAIAKGVGVVFQHFKLVPNQTVAENVALGLRKSSFILSLGKIEAEIAELSRRLNLPLNPRTYVRNLSVGEQQRLEIVKTLYLGAKILALDEPTASLTPQESQALFDALRRLAGEGYAIIFISHKLEEVVSLANRATILRGGRSVGTIELRNAPGEKERLARLMIGREADAEIATELGLSVPSPGARAGTGIKPAEDAPLLSLEEVWAVDDTGQERLKAVSLTARRGEIVGLVGVAGNGQRELAEVITGLRSIKRGTIRLEGGPVNGLGPREMSRRGVAFVPEDRLGVGLAPGLNLEDNYLLRHYWQAGMHRGALLRHDLARAAVARAIEQFDISVGDPFSPARLMSGGNLQKLLLARELARQPGLLVIANPTRGLDIGASAYVHARLRQARGEGAALLLIVEDLDEALALSDRLLVMYEGRIMGEGRPERSPANLQQIGLWMAGATGPESQ